MPNRWGKLDGDLEFFRRFPLRRRVLLANDRAFVAIQKGCEDTIGIEAHAYGKDCQKLLAADPSTSRFHSLSLAPVRPPWAISGHVKSMRHCAVKTRYFGALIKSAILDFRNSLSSV